MSGFARSRVIEGGAQVEIDTDTAQALCSLLRVSPINGREGLERLAKVLEHTLLVDRPDYSRPIMDNDKA